MSEELYPVEIGNSLVMGRIDTPTREGEVVNSLAEVERIPTPYVGMRFYDRETKREYVVTSLKMAVIKGVEVDNAVVGSYAMVARKGDVDDEVSRAMAAEANLKAEAAETYLTIEAAEAEHDTRLEAEQELRTAIADNRKEAAETYETIENVEQVQRTFSEELGKKLSKEEAKDIYITYADAEAEHDTRLEAEQELRTAIASNRAERITADETITAELESIKKAIEELEKSVVKSDSVKTIQTVSEREYQQLVETESRNPTVCYLIKEE